MKNILHIISSPRGEASYSTKLGRGIIEKIKAGEAVIVRTHDLTEKPFEHLAQYHLSAFFTRPHEHTVEQQHDIQQSEQAISELLSADIIIISVPVYNFNIHSTLKAWIDHIVRVGRTVRFNKNMVEGLVRGKKVYLAIASKGVYSEGGMKQFDFVEPYLRHILGYLGMTDMQVLRVEGSSVPTEQQIALESTLKNFNP
ncbi:MAG TPA: NAD(P)H-dependent oxidoreductase [Chryseolinea sp.]